MMEKPGVPEDFDVTRKLRAADLAASIAHNFVHGLKGVTKEQADAAIWMIHDTLRPLFEEEESESLIKGDVSLIPEPIREDMLAMVAEMNDPNTRSCTCGYPAKPCLRIMLRNGPPFPARPCEPTKAVVKSD